MLEMRRRDALGCFSFGLARETETSPGERVETLRRDRLIASLTSPVDVLLQLVQRLLDVVNQAGSVIETLNSDVTVRTRSHLVRRISKRLDQNLFPVGPRTEQLLA